MTARERQITFTFEERTYVVGMNAYDLGYAELPDGRFVRFNGWLDSLPPQPMGVQFVSRDEAYAPVQARLA